MTAKYGIPYFSNYVNSDMKPSDIRSMCPLYGKEQVLVREDYKNEFHTSTIENLYKGGKTYQVLLNGEIKYANVHRFNNLDFYRVNLVNGHKIDISGNHLNLTLDGVKQTTELTTDDYLPFETTPFEGYGLEYEDGYFVGAFMGDGSIKDDYAVVYSLNDTSKSEAMEHIISMSKMLYGARVKTSLANDSGTCINVTVTSKMLRGLISDFVSGKGTEKRLNVKAVGYSMDFRQGIIDGLMATDGNYSSKRIYTASEGAVSDICSILASMGIPTSVRVDERKGVDGKLSNNPVYSIRPYNVERGQSCYAGVYVKKDGYMWFKVDSIEKLDTKSSIGYCFEVLDDELPYFMMPNGLVTHNCRLRLDLRELRNKGGGYFGSGESTGSIGVVTINMPRLGYLAKNETEFYEKLDKLMSLAARSLKIKRNFVTGLMEKGFYPYTKRYLGSFDNHFSTIGIVGMNECCLNAKWLRKDLGDAKALQFTKDVLNHMRTKLSDFQELYGDLYNLEATPAESTAYRFAKHDKEHYPDILTANEKGGTPYYTNSSHLPVNYTNDIFEALDIQDELQVLYTSGTVFHTFLGEKLTDWKAAATLVKKIAEQYKLPYYTISPTYSVCPNHGYLAGEVKNCPECGERTEIYSRITGYYRPVQNWNDGKVQEFEDRKTYEVA